MQPFHIQYMRNQYLVVKHMFRFFHFQNYHYVCLGTCLLSVPQSAIHPTVERAAWPSRRVADVLNGGKSSNRTRFMSGGRWASVHLGIPSIYEHLTMFNMPFMNDGSRELLRTCVGRRCIVAMCIARAVASAV